MLINASHPEENRVAIVVDGILSELDIEIAGQEQSKGNIYKAVVVRVETGLQAAFVDYGAEKLGFLQIGEIHPNIYPPKDDSRGRPRIADILHRGQEILVQIVKEERGTKGAALTTFLSIPGRYMVLMPDSTTKGVSRKISDDTERKKLKRTMAELELPEDMGYIVRTAGIGKDKDELKRDFDYLVRLYQGIVARQDQIKAPAQLYQESNLAIRSIRDYFSTEMDEVLVDSQEVYQDTKDFFALVMPEFKHLVKQHRERRPIFSRYQIEEQIDGLAKNKILLPSGGSIVIDQTEALVAIDVNSGKMASESGIEATALKTNMEAAGEIGRQLRLRDLGGLIVIDFIDMRDRKNIREVEQELRKALKDDKAKVSVGRISQFGLMEMSRQRLKPTLSVGAYVECPHCKGIGRIKSVEAQAVALLRQAHTAASKGQVGLIEASVPVDVANYLLNQKRVTIAELEKQLNLKLSIHAKLGMLPGDLEFEIRKREVEQEDTRQILPVSHANQIEVALAAAQKEEQEQTKQADDTTEPDQNMATGPETSEAPKKRRRRRRKKPATSETSTTDQAAQDIPVVDSVAGEPQPATPPEATEQSVEQQVPEDKSSLEKPVETEKPKRRPRRPAKRKTPATEVESSTTATGANGISEESSHQLSTPQNNAVQKSLQSEPKVATKTAETESSGQKKSRRTARKKPLQAKAEGIADKKLQTLATPSAGTIENLKAANADKQEEQPQKTSPAVDLQAEGETTNIEAKPKRRPRRSATKKSIKANTDQMAQQSDEITDIEEEDKKQKPPSRSQRSKQSSPDEVSAVGEKATQATNVPAKRRPRRSVTKKSQAAVPPEQSSSEKSRDTLAEKPAVESSN